MKNNLAKIINRLFARPDYLFLFFSIPFGLIFVFLIPPLGGTDEIAHYQRITSIAYNQLLNAPVMVSSAFTDFIQYGNDFFYKPKPAILSFFYSTEDWQKARQIHEIGKQSFLSPKSTTIYNPCVYIPQILTFYLGILLGLTPLCILYLARLSGLVTGIALTVMAIRRMPSHKYALCALSLLPTISFFRSLVSADALTEGLSFLFIATILSEITPQEKITKKNIFYLAATAFILAQCKSAYFLLPLLALAIPLRRFPTYHSYITNMILITVPGIIANIAWIALMKQTYFHGASYPTPGGNVNPDIQMAYIIHYPIGFFKVILTTISTAPFLLSLLETVADVGPGYYLPTLFSIMLTCFFVTVLIFDKHPIVRYTNLARLLSTGIFFGTILLIMTMLYVQWTGSTLPEIKGFQGRYLYPILPLLLPFMMSAKEKLSSLKPSIFVALLATFGLTLSVWRIAMNYY